MKRKERRETFPCKNCIVYAICLEKSIDYNLFTSCSILFNWCTNLIKTVDGPQGFYLYDKYFPSNKSITEPEL
jgi:hypothetical protein